MAQVLESVFGRRELDAVSVEEIRALIAEFPSFNAGHYLLSYKLKDGDAVAYAAATRQTALYFNNPLWLQHLLEEPSKTTGAVAASSEPSHYNYWPLIETPPRGSEVPEPLPEENHYSVNDVFHQVQEDIPTVNDALHSVQDETPTVNDVIHSAQGDLPTIHEVLETAENPATFLNETLAPVSGEEAGAIDNDEQTADSADKEALLNETYGGVNQEDAVTADDLPQPDPMFDDNPAFEWPAESTPDLTVTPLSEDPAPERVPESALSQPEPGWRPKPEAESKSDPEPDLVPSGISAGLAAAAAELAPRNPADNPFDERKAKAIVFEPYHTIDYFASQGIKLVLDDNPADSFGRQLKSFTEWLKTMKRLPVQPLTGKADETETAEVKNFAAHSVEDRDILTETMAEVLVKQGMIENAVAIYGKLSLINPLKSAYFAARIQQLKAFGK